MELLLGLVSLMVFAYLLLRKRYNYWTDRGMPSVKPRFPYGNLRGVNINISIGERIRDLYFELKGKAVIGGVYFYIMPTAIVTDLDFLRTVFVKDFQYFQNRGALTNPKDPVSCHLFALQGEEWKNMRSKLSPTFTSGKLKMMQSTFQLVADQFVEHMRPIAERGEEVEFKALCSQFATDVIGNVAFGLECNSMKDPESLFSKYGYLSFQVTRFQSFKNLLLPLFPKLVDLFNIRLVNKETSEFVLATVKKTIEYREQNNVQRNDLMQLLMQIKNQGKLDGDTTELGKLSVEEIAAQTFLFFIAGLLTSSSTMSFAAYELARNPEMQDKAREEIQSVLKKYDGVMSYEAVQEFTYLSQFIDETLRKYPISPFIRRIVGKRYQVPNSDIVLEKDTRVVIPVIGIHHDPEYYPDPDKFDPDRFSKKNIAARHPYAYIPFGDGPRGCIGERFALIEVKFGLATLLRNFRFLPTENTPTKIKLRPANAGLNSINGIRIRFEPV